MRCSSRRRKRPDRRCPQSRAEPRGVRFDLLLPHSHLHSGARRAYEGSPARDRRGGSGLGRVDVPKDGEPVVEEPAIRVLRGVTRK